MRAEKSAGGRNWIQILPMLSPTLHTELSLW